MSKVELPEELENALRNIPTAFYVLSYMDENENNVRLKLRELEDNFHLIENDIKKVYQKHSKHRELFFNYLSKNVSKINIQLNNKILSFEEERRDVLNNLLDIIHTVFNKPIVTTIKLKINANNNVIYDLIKQLKSTVIQEKTPILTQSYDEIAEFLKLYISNFENTDIVTISKELARVQTVKKGRLIIKTE